MKLVSIVIPVYNYEMYLAEAIQSALDQSFTEKEVIVVNDGSSDRSGEIAQGFGDAITYVRQDRGGNGAARNLGVARSNGEYLSFLDADDRWHDTKIEREVALLEADPQLDGVRSLVREFISPEMDEEARQRVRSTHDVIPALLHYGTMRRSAFDRIGGFTTDLQLAVGVDFSAQWADLGLRSHQIEEVLVERRLHSSNNWARESSRHSDLAMAVKASLERRRKASAAKRLGTDPDD
jgi:glycosyltransferase involved in cell wall biosynthesis